MFGDRFVSHVETALTVTLTSFSLAHNPHYSKKTVRHFSTWYTWSITFYFLYTLAILSLLKRHVLFPSLTPISPRGIESNPVFQVSNIGSNERHKDMSGQLYNVCTYFILSFSDNVVSFDNYTDIALFLYLELRNWHLARRINKIDLFPRRIRPTLIP